MIQTIRLPLPFELEHVNVGLVPLDDGYMLIDTGMAGGKSFHALEAGLQERGLGWHDVRNIVATHIHPDHIGGLPRVLEATGAHFAIHHAELEYLNSILEGDTPWVVSAFIDGGVPREDWDRIRESLTGMRGALAKAKPDQILYGGEEFATRLGPARVIPTPGHSAGHVCLYWPQERLLYAGDHLIQNITPNIGWMPGRDMLGEYLASLTTIENLDIRLVISSHGEPFEDHRDWIAATRRHHDERCDGILALIESEPRTASELVPALWNKDFAAFHFYFALFEVLAHLEHMRRQGRVSFEMSEDGSRRWQRIPRPGVAAS